MRSAVLLLGLQIAGPAHPEGGMPVRSAQAPGHNPLDCYCRAEGRKFSEGEGTCLTTAAGPRLAQCRMEINVMSWGITETPCPEA